MSSSVTPPVSPPRQEVPATKSVKYLAKSLVGRELVKLALRPLVRWKPMASVEPGWSLILGVPWHLRHLLPVNLEFVARTNLAGLHTLHVVFDRRARPDMEVLADAARAKFPQLPLRFHHYAAAPGRVIERVNVSTFYNSMNCATALACVTTRHVVIHDFDLYPLVPQYFQEVVARMSRDGLRFCALERTYFDGLVDADNVLGTWCLGVDAQWLRDNYHPIDIFHKVEKVHGRWMTLDPFSSIQLRTPERSLVESIDGTDCCHVKNLCATYMRYSSGQRVRFAWKLHYMWYLEAINGEDRLQEITDAMESSSDGVLRLASGFQDDFSGVDPTCANVLRDELGNMERFLFGGPRRHVVQYCDSFQAFLTRAPARSAGDGAGRA